MLQVMPPVSIILLGYIAYVIGTKRNSKKIFIRLFSLTLALEMTTSMGYFIKIGDFDISLNNGVSLFALAFGLIMVCQRRYYGRIIKVGILFFVSAIIGLLLYNIHPYSGKMLANISYWDIFLMGIGGDIYRKTMDSSSIMGLINLFKWVTLISVVKGICKKEPLCVYEILDRATDLSLISLGYGVTEFLFKNILRVNTTPFALFLFGKKTAQFDGSLIRGGTMQKIGLFSETSFYTYSLFFLCIMYLILMNHYKGKNTNRYNKIRVMFVLSAVLMIFTFSFFVIIAVPLMFIAYLVLMKDVSSRKVILRRVIKALLFIALCSLVLVVILKVIGGSFYDYYTERIIRTIQNLSKLGNLQTGTVGLWSSETTRLTSIVECLKIFVHRPIFGVGIAITDCHSTIVSLLTTMGLIGFICWLSIIKRCGDKFNIISLLLFIVAFFIGGSGLIFSLSFGVLTMGYEQLQFNDDKRLKKIKKY